MISKNTICLWYDKDALEAAQFYARTFPDSAVGRVLRAPGDYPSGTQGDVLTVEFTVAGVACLGLNGGTAFAITTTRRFRSPPTTRRKPTACGTPSLATAARKAPAAGARTSGACHGRSRRAPSPRQSPIRPGGGQARVRGDDDDGQDRHRGDRGGAARVTRRSASGEMAAPCRPGLAGLRQQPQPGPLHEFLIADRRPCLALALLACQWTHERPVVASYTTL